MKPSLYKIALTAFVCLTGFSAVTVAQSTASGSSSSTQPAQAPTPPPAVQVWGESSPHDLFFEAPAAMAYSLGDNLTYSLAPLAAMGDVFSNMAYSQDTTYTKKMKQLQEQMRELQKQMSSLRTDEIKKNSTERSKQMQERMADMNKRMAESFNKSFSQNFDKTFQNFGQNMHFKFNFDNTEDLDKKVASGEYKLKSKSYSKSYPIAAKEKLQIENHYGKVTVNTWNKNEVKVDVEIKAYANTDEDAQKLIDLVNINDKKDNDNVSFTTVIGDQDHKNNFWGTMTSNGKTTVRKTIINYTVYMPAKSALTLSNSYGAVVLPEMSGKLSIKNTYGNFTAKALINPDNDITVRYGSADIENLVGGDLNVAYGSVNLKSADKLNAKISYSPAKIGTISTSGNIDLRYGEGVQIDNLGKNLKTLSINSQFAPIKLASLTNDNADFDVSVHNGGFSYDNGVSVISKSPDDTQHWSSTQTYKGKIGKGNPDKVIIIKTNYSSVKFDQ